jgi:hypothetical protein
MKWEYGKGGILYAVLDGISSPVVVVSEEKKKKI